MYHVWAFSYCYPKAPYFLCLQAFALSSLPNLFFQPNKLLHNIPWDLSQLKTPASMMASTDRDQNICTTSTAKCHTVWDIPHTQMTAFHPSMESALTLAPSNNSGTQQGHQLPAERLDEVKPDDEIKLTCDYAHTISKVDRTDSQKSNVAFP